jgi:hypothetical protein
VNGIELRKMECDLRLQSSEDQTHHPSPFHNLMAIEFACLGKQDLPFLHWVGNLRKNEGSVANLSMRDDGRDRIAGPIGIQVVVCFRYLGARDEP